MNIDNIIQRKEYNTLAFYIDKETGDLHFEKPCLEIELICLEKGIEVYEAPCTLFVKPQDAYTVLVICAKHHRVNII